MPQLPNPFQPLLDRRQYFGDCALACGVLENLIKCSGPVGSPEYKSCECSVFNAAGPVKVDICAACWAYFVPAYAAVITDAGKICAGAAGAVTTALAACSNQCAAIVSGFATCSSTQCLCPTVSVNGPDCSACLGPVNTADAGFVESLMSDCGVTGGGANPAPSPMTSTPLTTGNGVNTCHHHESFGWTKWNARWIVWDELFQYVHVFYCFGELDRYIHLIACIGFTG